MADLDGLIFYAQKRETQKALTPLWLVHFAIAKLAGTECINPKEFFGSLEQRPEESGKTAEEIEAEFAPIIAEDRKRGGVDG